MTGKNFKWLGLAMLSYQALFILVRDMMGLNPVLNDQWTLWFIIMCLNTGLVVAGEVVQKLYGDEPVRGIK